MQFSKVIIVLISVLVVLIAASLLYLGIRASARPFKAQEGNELPGSIAML